MKGKIELDRESAQQIVNYVSEDGFRLAHCKVMLSVMKLYLSENSDCINGAELDCLFEIEAELIDDLRKRHSKLLSLVQEEIDLSYSGDFPSISSDND